MKKLTLRKAISLFNKGAKIYLKPSKYTLQQMQYSPWLHWYDVSKEFAEGESFINIVYNFKYYNCNKDSGLRVQYYAYL